MVPDRLLIIDTETGGVGFDSAHRCAIIQLGAVVWERDKPEPGFDQGFHQIIMDPTGDLDEEALKVNGFTREKILEYGVGPVEALLRFEHFLGRHCGIKPILCGHNIGYDVQYLARLYRIAGAPHRMDEVFNYRTLDTASIARFLILAGLVPLQEPTSISLFEHFGCKPVKAHDAFSDAVATHNLLTAMLNVVRKIPGGYCSAE